MGSIHIIICYHFFFHVVMVLGKRAKFWLHCMRTCLVEGAMGSGLADMYSFMGVVFVFILPLHIVNKHGILIYACALKIPTRLHDVKHHRHVNITPCPMHLPKVQWVSQLLFVTITFRIFHHTCPLENVICSYVSH